MPIEMEDKTGQPRSEQDLIEAQNMIKKKFISIAASKMKVDIIQEILHFPVIIEAIDELIALRKYSDIYKHILQNLLAIIHRDGGHYTEEHGLEKSVEDAIKVVAKERIDSEKTKCTICGISLNENDFCKTCFDFLKQKYPNKKE